MRYFLMMFIIIACSSPRKTTLIKIQRQSSLGGSAFYKQAAPMKWKERDSFALSQILQGDIPGFLKKFVRINTQITSNDGKVIRAHYYVMPDYLSIGTDEDFARIPLTPMAAQQIADSFHCFLPTRKIVTDVYDQAKVKLEPVPMYAFRDSTVTMWQHHLIIEGQRKQRKGLIAGIKKDVVITEKLTRDAKPDRVAIYGWHKLDGKAIQPLYTGHVNWYVDYSHGIRLVYRTIWVNNKRMNYIEVLKNPELRKLLCDEEFCDFYHY
jgi:hypothetical protein